MSTINRAAPLLRLSNKDQSPLSEAQIRSVAPSVYTDKARSDFSQRYQVVPTFEIMAAMRADGFVPMEVQAYRRFDPKRIPYAMHMIRFGQVHGKALQQVGDVAPQIIMRNSHDGSSPFEIYSGFFRLVCLNGLIVSDSETVTPIKVRHTSRVVLEAMFAVHDLVNRQKLVLEHMTTMRNLQLSAPQQAAFAADAIKLRPNVVGVITPDALLAEHRAADKGNDLWRVYNRVQENLIRGGQAGETATKRKTTVRGVDSISASLDVNSRLWTMAMQVIAKAARKEGEVVSVQ